MKRARLMAAIDATFDREIDELVKVYLASLRDNPRDPIGALDRFVLGCERHAAAHDRAAAGIAKSNSFED